MELNEFSLFSADVLTLVTDENISGFSINQSISIHSYHDDWMVIQGAERVVVRCNKSDKDLFRRLVMRDQTRWLLAARQKKSLQIQYCAPVEVSPMDLELGVDGQIADDLYTKQEINDNSVELACQWMSERFVVKGLKEGDWLTIARFSNNSSQGAFQLLGNGWRADIEKKTNGGLLVKRITQHRRRGDAFSLIIGNFVFRDTSVAAVLSSASQQAVLSAALRDSASYLELWNLYNTKEWQNALKQAETLRALRFAECEGFQDGRDNAWRLTPKSQDAFQEFRDRWRSLDLTRSAQVDLGSTPPDWAEELSVDDSKQSSGEAPRGTIHFEIDSVVFKPTSNARDVRPKFPEGWLYLSMAGYRTVAHRRQAAKRSIDSGKRLPQLKWLLEGMAVPSERRRPKKGMTPYARETFKGGKPTDKQNLALDTALNTPDIAIIIGPPGTGKTQVIAALQRRLAEEAEDQNIAGQVLISSSQHDAVDNALERSDVFNLPGVRVGGKRGSSEEDNPIDPWIEAQRDHLQSKIVAEYAKYPEMELIKGLSHKLALVRITRCSPVELAQIFIDVLDVARELESHGLTLSARLEQAIEDYIAGLQIRSSKKSGCLSDQGTMRRIRALRVESSAFQDDGAERAWDLLSWLKRQGDTPDSELCRVLEEASDCTDAPETLLGKLLSLKNTLIDHCLPDYRPTELKHQLDEEGFKLLGQLEQHLEDKVRQRKQGVAWVLEQLATSLEVDRFAATKATEAYSMVVGATCQQAASRKMASLKSVAGLDSTDIEFDTVVVDEAARANPLDLFVPMSMAKRRIVLVGDDRQLPHMLEPDIEGQLQEEHQLTEQQLAAFRSSLFERLRIQLQELEKLDTNRRVVMLDTQFRMHPVLGDFISKQFYEAVGIGKIQSGRGVEDFAFDQIFLNALGSQASYYHSKVCQWIDIPTSAGADRKRGTSRIREVEADLIAKEVKRLMEAGGESLSVGVITFYAAQRDLILEKLIEVEIDGVPLMRRKQGAIEPDDTFKWARKTKADGSVTMEERLRVGSVDAFQGKEFDIVLLSCVRTFRAIKSAQNQDEDINETRLNRQFGFLRLPNRMNVAMSRQRQMLICVGDAALATNPDAEDAVPSLAAFYQLCGGEYGSIR